MKIIKITGIIGFIICLWVMYATNHGIRGIKMFDNSFRLLDMRFHYSSESVRKTFENIKEGGRTAYRKYLILDFIFIICFLITMFIISDRICLSPHVKTILYVVCILRALFDIIENTLLLYMLGQFPEFGDNVAMICSWFTTFKFIMLYIWYLSIGIQAVILVLNFFRKYI